MGDGKRGGCIVIKRLIKQQDRTDRYVKTKGNKRIEMRMREKKMLKRQKAGAFRMAIL